MARYRVTTDLNLRQGPSSSYPQILVLEKDTEVERLDGNGWFYVRTGMNGGREGWVNGDHLEEVAGSPSGPPDRGRELSNVRFNKVRRQQYVDSIMNEENGAPSDEFNFLRASDQTWGSSGRWIHGYRDGGRHFSVAASWPVSRNEGRLEIVEPTRVITEQQYEDLFGLVGSFTYCNFNISYCYCQAYSGFNLQSPQGSSGPELTANRLYQFFGDNWKEVRPRDAAQISNAGGFVVASWFNSSGHGHVVFLVDECPETDDINELKCFHVGAGVPRLTTVRGAFGTRPGVKLFVDVETHREWFNLRPDVRPPAEVDSAPFSINTNLKTHPHTVTAKSIDDFLRAKNSPLAGIGQGVIDGANKYAINAVYIVAHAIHETGWGRSRIYREKNNLFGWGAIDSSPFAGAGKFPSPEVCIDYVMGKINNLYLKPSGRYYERRPCLGNKDYGMNVHYASDKDWGKKIAAIAQQIEKEASPS